MEMTDHEQKELRAYCAFLLKEYGFHFSTDDPVIPALFVIHKEMQLNTVNNKALALQVKEATAKINPTTFHFHSDNSAFKFQLGAAVKWMLYSLPVSVMALIGVWYWSMVKNIEDARVIVEASANMGGLLKRVKKDKSGYYSIDFTLSKGDSIQPFREYEKINNKTIRVYVGKSEK